MGYPERIPIDQLMQSRVIDGELCFKIDYANRDRPILDNCKKDYGYDMLDGPCGIATDHNDNIYVVDSVGKTDCVQVFSNNAKHFYSIGNKGNSKEQKIQPTGIVISNNLVFVSQKRNPIILVFDLNGEFVTKFGTWKEKPGATWRPSIQAAHESFKEMYVCDKFRNCVYIISEEFPYLTNIKKNLIHPSCIKLTSDSIFILDYGIPCFHQFSYMFEPMTSTITELVMNRLINPDYFSFDAANNILLISTLSHNVLVFNSEGKLIHEIAKEVRRPISSITDSKGRIIVVSNRYRNYLQVY